jgi:uncharacterized SAM-binding protein YcdF (DUF218 family)
MAYSTQQVQPWHWILTVREDQMALFRILRRFVAWFVVIYLGTLAFVAGFALLQPYWEPTDIKADLIIVLGGGMSPRGTLHTSSTVRVDKGTALFKAGVAPRIHFTGGLASPNAPSAGQQMAARAIADGIPETATSSEGQSYSTLQNALFSKPDWQGAKHIVLVTEGFHLPRSWATFKAFGAQKITLVHARRFRWDRIKAGFKMIVRDALAIWFNAARLGVWQLAELTNMPTEERDALLY